MHHLVNSGIAFLCRNRSLNSLAKTFTNITTLATGSTHSLQETAVTNVDQR